MSETNQLFHRILIKLEAMDKKLDDILYEDDIYNNKVPSSKPVQYRDEPPTSDDLYKKGQKIPYNKIAGEDQLKEFREFLYYIRMNEDQFTQREFEFASYADKNFDDIRISDNSRRILAQAYQKAYHRQWPFKFERGYMYKYLGSIGWQWGDVYE